MDAHHRSIAKATSWRLVAATTTGIIALVVTGEWRFVAAIGLADALLKFGLYYVHERVWDRVGFGRSRAREYDV
ncbi:MAG: DUF2061 domain-containing protein [Planctomycetota bacterium]